ncbi:MAG: hypothetical protein VKO21_00185 [Candidatus Sericytochromatia bacterium]|nr:hypothetical protein [Candidatus Sericytochromatia bacterium]
MSGFSLDLAVWSGATATLLLLTKLAAPSPRHDRLAGLCLLLAFFAASAGMASAAGQGGALPAWCLYCSPLLALYWILETEFATRLLGLVPAALVTLGPLLIGHERLVGAPRPVWTTITDAGLIIAMAFLTLALGTWALLLPLRVVPAVQARKTARMFVINPPVLAELAFRCNTWALPFVVGASASALLGIRPGHVPGEVLLWLLGSLVGNLGYATLARRDGPSWALLLLAGAVTMAAFGWRGLPGSPPVAP